jgi:putative phage-type endonuclease
MDEDYKKLRREGVGGSDAAAILGLSPWKSAMDVWLEKKGLAEERNDPNRDFLLDLGTQLEPVIARCYERQTGVKLTLPFPLQWTHKKYPVLRGSPDRFVEGVSRGVELKSENQFSDQFGEPGTDQVPYHYLVQCAHYMAVLDYDVWDVALLHGGTRFAVYTIHRDKELEASMTEQLLDWWERYIVKDVPPDVDGSGAWKVYLRKKYPVNLLPIKQGDEETLNLVKKLEWAGVSAAACAAIEEETKNRLKLLIGEHDGIQGEFGKITWKKTKDSESVDWELTHKDFLRTLAAKHPELWLGELHEVHRTIQRIHTMPRQGTRRFLFQPAKGWNDGSRNAKQIGQAGTSAADISGTAGALQAGDRPRLTEASES